MKNSFLFLGTGASMGTPVLTCHCPVCSSSDQKNHRLRPAGLLKLGDKQFLIDAGPDYRQQALKFGIERLDGVLITHTHFDHIAGLDDLRVYYFLQKKTLPCLLSRASYDELKIRHHYLFTSNDDAIGGARFRFQVVEDDFGEVEFEGEKWQIMSYEQGGMKVMGIRWRKFAYVTDLKVFTPELYSALKGVEVLVMSALRCRPSPAHLTMEEAVAFAKKVGAKETWFSHVSHELDHAATNRELPAGVKLAHDGLLIDVN